MMPATVRVPIGKIQGRVTRPQEDSLAVEEPLEIRVGPEAVGHHAYTGSGFRTGGRFSICGRHHQRRQRHLYDRAHVRMSWLSGSRRAP